MNLSGKCIVVTGARGGLGSVLVPMLAEAGAHVIGAVRNVEALASIPPEAEGAVVDVLDEESVEAFFDGLDEVWGVVSLVGGYAGGNTVAETPTDELEKLLALNLTSAFLCAKAAINRMSGPGRLVFVSSAAADRGTPQHFAYCASKAGILRLAESAAEDHKAQGITSNTVQPGMIATTANLNMMPDADHTTWVTPEQVSNAILFLLSDAASGVNGATIRVTGKG